MLKDIKATILKDAKKEGEAALLKAEEELEAELKKVKSAGEEKVALAEAEAKRLAESERRERISWAKLEAKRTVSEAKEDSANVAFDALIERIKRYAGTRPYAEKMREKIASAIREVGGKAVVRVKKGEKKLLSLNGIEVREDADISGGAVVESKDGRMRVDLSMDSMLAAQKDAVRKETYARLFK